MALNKYDRNFKKLLLKIKRAGLENAPPPNRNNIYIAPTDSLKIRIQKILDLYNSTPKISPNMLYFIMYDIEDNKVRTHIAKFLERKGFIRIQKSIFLAKSSPENYRQIHQILAEVNQVYENHDSIFLVPVSPDQIRSMKIIGKNINLDIILGNNNTLIF